MKKIIVIVIILVVFVMFIRIFSYYEVERTSDCVMPALHEVERGVCIGEGYARIESMNKFQLNDSYCTNRTKGITLCKRLKIQFSVSKNVTLSNFALFFYN